MKTTNTRRQIAYEGFDKERWLMTVGFDNEVVITCNGETRTYTIPEKIVKIQHDTEYVFLYVEGKKFYQFKFEENNFLVGDIFTNDGEHLDSFSCYVFGEDI